MNLMNGRSNLRVAGCGGGNTSRLVGLDFLRIALALLVFLFHSHIHVLKCDYGWLNAFVDMGAIAMTGFFLLSGYVLEYTSGKKNMTEVREIKVFYIKRLISIFPLYYAYAIINVATNILLGGKNVAIQEVMLLPIEALGIQSSISGLTQFSHNGGSWFISCILICYIVYPLIHVVSKALSNSAKVWLAVLLAGILLWSPIVQHFFKLDWIYSNPFMRIFEFTIGILVLQLNASNVKDKFLALLRKPAACIATIMLLVVGVSIAYHIGVPHDYMLYSWIALPCFVSLLFSLGSIKFVSFQNSKVVRYLSALSFAIFLSQLIVVWKGLKHIFEYLGVDNNLLNILVSALVCFCMANFLHYCVEKPCAKYLKEKLL